MMKYRQLLCLPVCAASLLFSFSSIAHGGGQDGNGGHVNKATGVYHCHASDCVLPIITAEDTVSQITTAPTTETQNNDYLKVISFNIQFLGNFKKRDDKALADFVADNDIVVIQELVAPPYSGRFPDNNLYKADAESKEFFEAMEANGFKYVLSEEDTGTGDRIHVNNASTEWFVTFYRPNIVHPDFTLPNGFLGSDRSNHDDFERVPYATSFKINATGNDFVLVSVHLKPGDGKKDRERRRQELAAIAEWVETHDEPEKDFFILGDMNFKNCAEIEEIMPDDFTALNAGPNCLNTNTNVNSPKPYDNVLYPNQTNELFADGHFKVINLIDGMEKFWFKENSTPYPGNDPYIHNAFRVRYSDHHPVQFAIQQRSDDD